MAFFCIQWKLGWSRLVCKSQIETLTIRKSWLYQVCCSRPLGARMRSHEEKRINWLRQLRAGTDHFALTICVRKWIMRTWSTGLIINHWRTPRSEQISMLLFSMLRQLSLILGLLMSGFAKWSLLELSTWYSKTGSLCQTSHTIQRRARKNFSAFKTQLALTGSVSTAENASKLP